MIDKHKAIFLPIDKRVINNYKGYILKGELLNLPEEKVLNIEIIHDYNLYDANLVERTVWILFNLLIFPVAVIAITTDHFIAKNKNLSNQLSAWTKKVFTMVFRKNEETWERKTLKPEYEDAIKEDVPAFLLHCRNCRANVYLYTYSVLTEDDHTRLSNLILAGHVKSFYQISGLTDLTPVLAEENISIHNSQLVITHSDERREAELLGFNPGNEEGRNVELLMERYVNGAGELERNGSPTFIGLKHKVSPYLKAKNNAFFDEETILFIDDKDDPFLNSYLSNNLNKITSQLKEAGKHFVYFPAFQFSDSTFDSRILDFVRYRLPVFYSLSDNELAQLIEITVSRITAVEFYKMVLEELQLPFFERPCLLRQVPGQNTTNNLFVSSPIKYQTQADLEKFFDAYIHRISNEKPNEIFLSLVPPPEEYDADWHFNRESNQFTEELKSKIDALRKENKHEALVDTIMYMLSTIKEDRPDIIEKVKPLLEKRKLLEPKVVLSSLVVDKHCNIFLPDFGNKELKLHALPKTVYLLFLRYPKGIRFKELYQYKAELLEIYNKVTNRYERQEIERAINDLVDMTNPSINQKCARIREAFRSIMGEHVAKYYYIDGKNGEEKRIILPQELIELRDK